MSLIHCIYASSATACFEEADIPRLLEGARARNATLGITGILLFVEGSFFQVLEGTSSAVDSVYAAIGQDRRHCRIAQIIREPLARRSFAHWSMGFATLNRGDATRLLGENDFFASASCLERVNAGRARKLLVAFSAGRWRSDAAEGQRTHMRVA
jgi:Sensors of blue-light using FAD